MLTMREHANKADSEIAFAYIGDAHNNVANSLLIAGAMLAMMAFLILALCGPLLAVRVLGGHQLKDDHPRQ